MLSYVFRRVLLIVPTLIGITLVTFCVMAFSPGGFKGAINAETGSLDPRARAAITAFNMKKFGYDKPLPEQYFIWVGLVSPIGPKEPGTGWPLQSHFGFKTPDLGESSESHRPVLDMIEESLPTTLLLNVITLPLLLGLSIYSGVIAAKNRGKWIDVGSGTLLLGAWSIPQIWAGVLLIGYLANKQNLKIFPDGGLHDIRADEMNFLPTLIDGFHRGWLLDSAWHLVLPIITLTYAGFAFTSKLTRNAMLDNLSADFVRTARAKGVSERAILYRHVLRNGLLPLITSMASLLPGLIGGSLIVETIYTLPGMGKLGVDAVFDKDKYMVLSVTLVASLLGLVSFLLADLCYALADPRVSFDAGDT